MRPAATLLALTCAAAFGGFAATALDGLLDNRAEANPAPAPVAPLAPAPAPLPLPAAAAALPAAIDGQALPSLAPMLKQVMPAAELIARLKREYAEARQRLAL